MADQFSNIEGFGEAAQVTMSEAPMDSVKQAEQSVINLIKHDANYAALRGSRSNDLKVTKILGFSDRGNLVDKTQEIIRDSIKAGTLHVLAADDNQTAFASFGEDGLLHGNVEPLTGTSKKYKAPFREGEDMMKNNKENRFRRVANEAENVGYEVQNVSNEPIVYRATSWVKDENGRFVPNEHEETIAPGAKVYLTRKELAMITIAVPFNMSLANGHVTLKKSKDPADALDLSNCYFGFDKNAQMDINSPDVKILIHNKKKVNGTTQYIVKPEFEEKFGYLNNAKDVERKQRAKTGITISRYEITAQQLREKLGMA